MRPQENSPESRRRGVALAVLCAALALAFAGTGRAQTHPYTMAALPDTGQVARHTTLPGEDADNAINPPVLRDNGDGTVTDRVTGLMWQKADGGEMTFEQALAYADALVLGGYTDWRLPFSHEAFSILNLDAGTPALDVTRFTASAAEYWWSGDTAVDNTAKAWVTNAGGGIGPHLKSETLSAGGTRRFHVRCVRDPLATGATHLYGSLTDNGDGTVTDNHTGLVWQKAESTPMTWEQALAYAEGLTLGGQSDWRLPNIKELRSINDDNLRAPSLDRTYFSGATVTRYWSSTTLAQDGAQAWYLDTDYGLTSYDAKSAPWHVRCVRGGTPASLAAPPLSVIPPGTFVMGDHFNYTDPSHPTDEKPLHPVTLDGFYLGTFDVTNREYCDFLNAALAEGSIEVRSGVVYAAGTTTILCETRSSTLYGVIDNEFAWSGSAFSVVTGREKHPAVGIRWEGAAAYANWLGAAHGYDPCYSTTTWTADLACHGYRLPTEAEWEYAANGGLYYRMFPWGDTPNADGTWSNWQASGDPYETGDYPWTTPVGFYNGALHTKAEYGWPGSASIYQTSNAVNGYGLYDMAGNVWQWTNDWYGNGYYALSPSTNPPGPTTGDPMPDGLPYHVLRGGNWYNGAEYYGHSRIANRDPGYYRGPQDPSHPYYHVGLRVALVDDGVSQPRAKNVTRVSTLTFGEGPAANAAGEVFFSDVKANTIYKWSPVSGLSTFRTNSGGANGLAVDASGNLIACEGTNGRVVSIDMQNNVTVLAGSYGGLRFNEPNDLWIAPNGGIYFTDPVFFGSQVQDGQHVYYINPSRTTVTRVVADMVRPNGIVGTPDGTTLYVSDYGAAATWRYTINADGSLSGKTLFVSLASDGMDIDQDGNVYLTTDDVVVYSAAGAFLGSINVLDRPTNLCFAGTDQRTLFITSEAGLYTIPVRTRGVTLAGDSGSDAPPTITGTTRTPSVPGASDAPWVTSRVTDDGSVSSVALTYVTGSGSSNTSTAFTETMTATEVRPWTGSGAVNAWTVTGTYCEQRLGSNYGTGNACGMQFKAGTTLNPLTSAMIATTNAINAAGTSGYVEFWIQTLALDGTDGWTFQLDAGSGFVTRLSELTGSSHAWQMYHYDLAAGELVATLKMRFQFTGGGTADDDRIDLDQVTVTVTTGSTPVTVAMLDDGAHGDGAAGDHVYGGQIPAMAAGTTVGYSVTATDGSGQSASDPATAPTDRYSYIVGRTPPTLAINEVLADAASFVATTDYPARTVGVALNESGAYPGYTLLDPMHNKTTYLVDNAGQVVHSWTSAYEPGRSVYLLPNGHLVRACMAPGGMSTGGGEGGRIEERDWDGNLVWYLDWATSTYMMHHDFKVMPNGHILMLVVESKTYAETLAAGFNPALLDAAVTTGGLQPDTVIEIAPTYPSGGTVVWEWHVWDHLVQDFSSARSNYGVVSAHPELVDANGTGIQIPQFWNHMNALDYNATLDQVVLSARNQDEVWLIDHATTTAEAAGHTGGAHGKGGDLLYRWGNPLQYDTGTSANNLLYQQHDTQWIAFGSPGAGNLLVFNNGLSRPAGLYSTVEEIVPPLDATGGYTRTAGQPFGPTAPAWSYIAAPPTSFYSAEISGAYRLPNGNTLVCEGNTGRLFEVTAAMQTVWQYQCPVALTGPLVQGTALPADPRGGYMTAVFKARRYGTDYAAFSGRTLTAQGAIELYPDWIEIVNTGSATIDMGGMYLTNDTAAPTKWQVPSGVTIPAGGYLLFWADGVTSNGTRHTSFTLDATGGTVALYDIEGITRIDGITYGALATDTSYARSPNGSGSWSVTASPTPGTANAAGTNAAPVIALTHRAPTAPAASDAVWVSSLLTDDVAVASAALTYSYGTTPTTTTVFTETMTSTPYKPWTGSGAVNAWTVTGSYLETRTGSNYGTGNVCGVEYKAGTTLNALTAAMAATTSAINATGTSGYVEFWLQSLTLDGTDGWTFQLDAGSGFVTRLSELTGSSHTWQKYHYDLASGELVATLKMRFQFTGGGVGDDDRIDLDQITITTTSGGTTTQTVTMYDDGAHGDGAAGDHVYGAQIPAQATGTTVSYYLTATDGGGLATSDPAAAPATAYTYTVGALGPPPVADGLHAGTAARFTRSASVAGQIDVTYGTTPCSGTKAVIVWGYLGLYSGYAGCALANAGNAGSAAIPAGALGSSWFNILWTSGATAGHPGFGSNGSVGTARAWTATGLCGITADDQANVACP